MKQSKLIFVIIISNKIEKNLAKQTLPVNNEALVEELQSVEQLDGDALDLGFREGRGHVVEQAGQVLLAILHHQKYAAKTNASLRFCF